MSNKILVAYATWAGATQSVAEFIGKTMQEKGEPVEVLPAKSVKDISGYDAVILGTAVHAGMLNNDSHNFVQRFAVQLPAKKVAYFVVCLTMSKDTPENCAQADAYIETLVKLAPEAKLLGRGKFGGVMDATKLRGLIRLMMSHSPQGDYRNWDAIKKWTEDLYMKLK